MAKQYKLEVEKRDSTRKADLKQYRKKGKIPGIYYSYDSKSSVNFLVTQSEIKNAIKSDANIFAISVGGENKNVLFKSVQYHPVTDEILHVDLYGIKMDQVVSVSVLINLTGTAKGVTEGGIVVQALNELEIECLPMDIPTGIEVDISELDIGDSMKVEDVVLDDKITAKSNADQIIVSITQAMKEEELIPQVDEDEELLEGEEGDIEASEASEEETKEDKSTDEDTKEDTKG